MDLNNLENNNSIPQVEDFLIDFWKENKTFEKSVEIKDPENLYVFYDGPPFISGLPHPGHLLSSVAKDIIPRYWTMKGKRVERVWGWDAHGLTVEGKVLKRIGLKSRKDIEEYGVDNFVQGCYAYTSEISAEWKWYIDKIARWVDMDNAYKTIDHNYMESVMWAFKRLYEENLIYEGVRTSLFCPTCGTPVSNFEISMDNTYHDFEDPTITVKFTVKTDGDFHGAHILAWTTTPWTIPSNRALVVAENEEYAVIESEGEVYILGTVLVENNFDDKDYKLLKTVKGKDLIGLEYTPIYDFYKPQKGEFQVYSFENMATMDDGTGIVHSAPGFGEIDTEMGRHYNLTVMLTIDDEGKFLPGDNGKNPFEGMFYFDANPKIIEDLKNKNVLFDSGKIIHRIPYHDRCGTNLIQKAQSSWFVDVQSLKSRLKANNEKINWVPSHLKYGRFGQNLDTQPDWCISRNRFWATPMPVWESEDGERIVVGSIAEIEELSGQKVKDLHRPYIDEITFERNGKTFRRRSEVLDSWLDAGSMPYAQLHYPFEHEEKFEKNFPGDYIIEYIGQVRAWFNVMHILSTAIFDRPSFKNVISTGVMAGNDGRKMSKTYGNYTDPKFLLETYGGDALRLYLMGSPLMVGENANFEEEEFKTRLRKVLNPLWNSAKFFLTYSKTLNDGKGWSVDDYVDSKHELDIWIKTRLHEVYNTFTENIEGYTTPPAIRSLEEFVDDLSRWYVRRSRERISSGDSEAISTLYYVLKNFSLVSAPAIPFMAERIYKTVIEPVENAVNVGENEWPESIHLCDYPELEKDLPSKNSKLLDQMDEIRRISSLGNALRVDAGIPVRQPLSKLFVYGATTEPSKELKNAVLEEINVKEIVLIDDVEDKRVGELESQTFQNLTVFLDTELTEELRLEGGARNMIRKIQSMRKDAGLGVGDNISVTYESNEENDNVVKKHGEMIKEKVQATNLTPGEKYELS